VRLVTAHGEDPGTAWHDRSLSMNTGPLLESLAVMETTHQTAIETSWLAESGRSGLTIAILGGIIEQDQPVLRRMQMHAGSALAIALNVNRWTSPGSSATHREVAWLAGQGWRAVSLSPQDRLSSVWQELGRVSSNLSLSKVHVETFTQAVPDGADR
jgi:hypothetical protein